MPTKTKIRDNFPDGRQENCREVEGERWESAFDFEAGAVGDEGDGFGDLVFDVAGDGGFDGDFVEEIADFGGFAHDLEFDAAIGEVFHEAADLEAASEVFDGVAESDALDAAFVDDFFGDHAGLLEGFGELGGGGVEEADAGGGGAGDAELALFGGGDGCAHGGGLLEIGHGGDAAEGG